jgi:hypothetical protein
MSALFAGHAASLAALGIELLVILLIALAAKLTYGRAHQPSRRCEERPRDPVVMHRRLKAKLEATIWPE